MQNKNLKTKLNFENILEIPLIQAVFHRIKLANVVFGYTPLLFIEIIIHKQFN